MEITLIFNSRVAHDLASFTKNRGLGAQSAPKPLIFGGEFEIFAKSYVAHVGTFRREYGLGEIRDERFIFEECIFKGFIFRESRTIASHGVLSAYAELITNIVFLGNTPGVFPK